MKLAHLRRLLAEVHLPWRVDSRSDYIVDANGSNVHWDYEGLGAMWQSDAHPALIVAAVSALPALLDVVEAGEATGWNELDGRCWCEKSRELTGKPDHEPRCARFRAALAHLEDSTNG